MNTEDLKTPEKAKNLEVVTNESTIKERAEELKKKHKLKEIFAITSGEKVGYMKRPSRAQMKYATQVAQGNVLELAEQVLRAGWLDGDEEIMNDDYHFYGVTDQIEQVIETVGAEIKKY